MAEYPDGDVRIAQDLLNAAGEGNDGRLVVTARPQVQPVVGLGLDLPAPLIEPRVQGVVPV